MGLDASKQILVDRAMIGSGWNRYKVGLRANAVLAVSLANALRSSGRDANSSLSLFGRNDGPRPAGADDEYIEWRQTCFQ